MKTGSRRKTTTSDLPPPSKEIPQNEGYEQEDGKSPKLAEGFYVIEVVRRKRIRKGVKQYLVKWRGWPESANTWETAESFASCPDVIEEFESMSAGKRKRKHSVGPTSQSKKKQQQDASVVDVHNSKVTENNVGPTSNNGPSNQSNGSDGKLGETKPTSSMNQETTTEFGIHIEEDPAEQPAKELKSVDEPKVLRASPRTGAKRRKSCAVKRFKKESNKKTTAVNDVIAEDDTKSETPQRVSVVTKIIKPVNYSVSVLNDTEEVWVSFLVMRSDGEEIVVDNKYLKENNPLMLINFYEQHLRYNSPSE
ncbi:chromo domain-containing protein LHP1-like [Bidens hawaiensis]|uniref:chromo domain-containing protein LHP1-like n=1 Tax=Bidens hawaiensis TaxID=980011 RepID=UPI00404B33B1